MLRFHVEDLADEQVIVNVHFDHMPLASVTCDPTFAAAVAALSAASDFRTAFIGASSGGG